MKKIEFWVSVGSTYSYLTVARLPAIEAATGLKVVWRPFSVRAIMLEMDNIPFARKPVKARYMWRDIARRAAMYVLNTRLPAPYPLAEFDLANRVAVVGQQEGWCRDYIRETYRRWFEGGAPAGSSPNLHDSLAALGHDPAAVIDRANLPATEIAYHSATEEARSRGIFGAPSFLVGDELFWGDDRLEDAIAWARFGRVGQPEPAVTAG
jgi:2-hydroxychromene-2-carboxylate isomerase